MSNRNDILNTIKTELTQHITLANGYSFTPAVVRRGIYAYNDLGGLIPNLCFTFIRETPYEDDTYPKTYDDTDIKAMSILFYGYANTDDAATSDKIYAMVNDLEVFLQSTNFTYYDKFTIDRIEIKEAGPNDPILSFIMETTLVVNDDIE